MKEAQAVLTTKQLFKVILLILHHSCWFFFNLDYYSLHSCCLKCVFPTILSPSLAKLRAHSVWCTWRHMGGAIIACYWWWWWLRAVPPEFWLIFKGSGVLGFCQDTFWGFGYPQLCTFSHKLTIFLRFFHHLLAEVLDYCILACFTCCKQGSSKIKILNFIEDSSNLCRKMDLWEAYHYWVSVI